MQVNINRGANIDVKLRVSTMLIQVVHVRIQPVIRTKGEGGGGRYKKEEVKSLLFML